MIGGIDPASLSVAYILAGLFFCAPQTPPLVEIAFNNQPPKHLNTLSSKELGGFTIDTNFSHHRNEVFTVGGITAGNINASFEMAFKMTKNPQDGQSCVWIEKAKVVVNYAPDVYIAREYAPGTCRYDQTLQHEFRHVNTDIITLNQYIPVIQKAAQEAIAQTYAAGPLPESSVTPSQEAMMAKLKKALADIVAQMNLVRLNRQQQIDTRPEYLRLSKACPPVDGR